LARLVGVPSPNVEAVWKFVERYIDRALSHGDGEFAAEDIRAALASRDMQLWVLAGDDGIGGAGVTQIITYPRKKYADLVLWGSDVPFEEFGPTLTVVEQWAEAQGAIPRLFGRRGWAKRLAGYVPRYTVFVRQP
jgi:hypothetical protein